MNSDVVVSIWHNGIEYPIADCPVFDIVDLEKLKKEISICETESDKIKKQGQFLKANIKLYLKQE